MSKFLSATLSTVMLTVLFFAQVAQVNAAELNTGDLSTQNLEAVMSGNSVVQDSAAQNAESGAENTENTVEEEENFQDANSEFLDDERQEQDNAQQAPVLDSGSNQVIDENFSEILDDDNGYVNTGLRTETEEERARSKEATYSNQFSQKSITSSLGSGTNLVAKGFILCGAGALGTAYFMEGSSKKALLLGTGLAALVVGAVKHYKGSNKVKSKKKKSGVANAAKNLIFAGLGTAGLVAATARQPQGPVKLGLTLGCLASATIFTGLVTERLYEACNK